MLSPVDVMAAAFENELQKIAASKAEAAGKATSGLAKHILPVAAGAVGFETLRRANQDRKMGKQIRQQQGY